LQQMLPVRYITPSQILLSSSLFLFLLFFVFLEVGKLIQAA